MSAKTSASAGPGASTDGSKANWRPEQESVLFDILSDPKLKPVGGDWDAKMAVRGDVIWGPAHARFMKELPAVNATLPKRRSGPPRAVFSVEDIKRRYKMWAGKYKETSTSLGIVNHPSKLASGAEVPGTVPAEKEEQAVEIFHLWARFHAVFGLCSRFRHDLNDESMSPLSKKQKPAEVLRPGTQRVAAMKGVKRAAQRATNGGVTPASASPPTGPDSGAVDLIGVNAAGTSCNIHTQPSTDYVPACDTSMFWARMPPGHSFFPNESAADADVAPLMLPSVSAAAHIMPDSPIPHPDQSAEQVSSHNTLPLSQQRAVAPRNLTAEERAMKRARKPATVGPDDVSWATSSDSEIYCDTLEPVRPNQHAERVKASGRVCTCVQCIPNAQAGKGTRGRGGGRGAQKAAAVGDSSGKAMRWTARDKGVAKEVANQTGASVEAGCAAMVAGDEKVAKLEIEARKEMVASLNQGNLAVAEANNKVKFADMVLSFQQRFMTEDGLTEDDAFEKAYARVQRLRDI